MTKIIVGDRIGKEGKLRLGCSAAIFDPSGEKVLLTRRQDNGQWCLPSGGMEPGESAAEACQREVWEETGLRVEIRRMVGVYSDPNKLVIYANGDKVQVVALHFEAQQVSGEPGLSNETSDWGYFSIEEAEQLEMLGNHLQRIRDTLACQPQSFIR